MFSVNTNLGALAALQSLSTTQSDLTATQNRVATGKKVSSASDNPAVFAIAQAMNDRLSGLAAVSDNLNFAQSVVGVAQAAATQISSQLATLKNTITQGQQAGIDTTTMNSQITAILNNIDSIAGSATFNGVNIAGGTGTDNITGAPIATTMNVTQDIQGTTVAVSTQNMKAAGLGLTGLNTSSGGEAVTFSQDWAAANDDHLLVTSAGKTYDFIFSDGSAANTLNQASDATHINTLVNISATGSATSAINSLRTAMESVGITSSVDTAGKLIINAATASTGTFATGTTSAAAVTAGATSAIAAVDTAIKSLNTKVATFGSLQQQFSGLQSFSSALSSARTTGLGALTDADMAAESAKLQSLQTKQQLGIQALSIANQQPQALLTLFR